jgi:hypothetical protein
MSEKKRQIKIRIGLILCGPSSKLDFPVELEVVYITVRSLDEETAF